MVTSHRNRVTWRQVLLAVATTIAVTVPAGGIARAHDGDPDPAAAIAVGPRAHEGN